MKKLNSSDQVLHDQIVNQFFDLNRDYRDGKILVNEYLTKRIEVTDKLCSLLEIPMLSDQLLFSELSIHMFFQLRQIAKSGLYDILTWLRTTDENLEFSEFMELHKSDKLSHCLYPPFIDLFNSVVRSFMQHTDNASK